ncbi:hypothetical protein [Veillonella intestinalis]|uniref:hypothetical protein n=1 Tax=Veillonella intestinalis TaxID=2941341 RepID=UPI00203F6AA7|nr:hypothetical protein [Veillonella intestinalis]
MKYISKTLAVLGLVGALSAGLMSSVQAQDYWYYVGADSHDNTLSIDNSSVDKEDDVAQLWIRVVQPGGDYYFEKMEIKKSARTIQTLEIRYFHNNGIPYNDVEYTYDTKPQAVTEGTMGEDIYKLVWGA